MTQRVRDLHMRFIRASVARVPETRGTPSLLCWRPQGLRVVEMAPGVTRELQGRAGGVKPADADTRGQAARCLHR